MVLVKNILLNFYDILWLILMSVLPTGIFVQTLFECAFGVQFSISPLDEGILTVSLKITSRMLPNKNQNGAVRFRWVDALP